MLTSVYIQRYTTDSQFDVQRGTGFHLTAEYRGYLSMYSLMGKSIIHTATQHSWSACGRKAKSKCLKCNVGLQVGCFENFHTKLKWLFPVWLILRMSKMQSNCLLCSNIFKCLFRRALTWLAQWNVFDWCNSVSVTLLFCSSSWVDAIVRAYNPIYGIKL